MFEGAEARVCGPADGRVAQFWRPMVYTGERIEKSDDVREF